MIIAIDTNIFIYALQGTSEFTQHAREVLAIITSGKAHGTASVLVLTEMMRKPSEVALTAVESTKNLDFIPVGREVALKAAELSVSYGGLKAYDELHLATAILAGADEFWTNDLDIVKLKGLPFRVCSLRSSKIL